MPLIIMQLPFPLQIDKLSESLDSWVKFQERAGLRPYIKINISLEPNTFKVGGEGGELNTADFNEHAMVGMKTRRIHLLIQDAGVIKH